MAFESDLSTGCIEKEKATCNRFTDRNLNLPPTTTLTRFIQLHDKFEDPRKYIRLTDDTVRPTISDYSTGTRYSTGSPPPSVSSSTRSVHIINDKEVTCNNGHTSRFVSYDSDVMLIHSDRPAPLPSTLGGK